MRRSTANYDNGHNNSSSSSRNGTTTTTKVSDCLVFIGFDTPFKVDGLASRQYKGVGLVIDRNQGEDRRGKGVVVVVVIVISILVACRHHIGGAWRGRGLSSRNPFKGM